MAKEFKFKSLMNYTMSENTLTRYGVIIAGENGKGEVLKRYHLVTVGGELPELVEGNVLSWGDLFKSTQVPLNDPCLDGRYDPKMRILHQQANNVHLLSIDQDPKVETLKVEKVYRTHYS